MEITKAIITDEYRKIWNIGRQDDFIHINGRSTLYRVGGHRLNPQGYSLILKYEEAQYSKEVVRITNSHLNANYLRGVWCIINDLGEEVREFEYLQSPYLVKDSILYTLNDKCYSIIDGSCYGSDYKKVECGDYLFLEQQGEVIQIGKTTGLTRKWK